MRLVYNTVEFLHALQPAVQAGRIPGNAVLADDQEVVLRRDARDTVMACCSGNNAILEGSNMGDDILVGILPEGIRSLVQQKMPVRHPKDLLLSIQRGPQQPGSCCIGLAASGRQHHERTVLTRPSFSSPLPDAHRDAPYQKIFEGLFCRMPTFRQSQKPCSSSSLLPCPFV